MKKKKEGNRGKGKWGWKKEKGKKGPIEGLDPGINSVVAPSKEKDNIKGGGNKNGRPITGIEPQTVR